MTLRKMSLQYNDDLNVKIKVCFKGNIFEKKNSTGILVFCDQKSPKNHPYQGHQERLSCIIIMPKNY